MFFLHEGKRGKEGEGKFWQWKTLHSREYLFISNQNVRSCMKQNITEQKRPFSKMKKNCQGRKSSFSHDDPKISFSNEQKLSVTKKFIVILKNILVAQKFILIWVSNLMKHIVHDRWRFLETLKKFHSFGEVMGCLDFEGWILQKICRNVQPTSSWPVKWITHKSRASGMPVDAWSRFRCFFYLATPRGVLKY